MIRADDSRSLALLFHLNSGPRPAGDVPDGAYEVEYKDVDDGTTAAVALPAPEQTAIGQLHHARYSCRDYLPAEMPLAELSILLSATYSITALRQLGGGLLYASRTVPSAGGLYPLEVYACTQRVQGVTDGLYHYDLRVHELQATRTGSLLPVMAGGFLDQPFVVNANVLIVLSAVFDRSLHKYGARGYRYILLEAGHAAQNLCLVAAERHLASVCLGGFSDTRLNGLLGLDGVTEAAVYGIAVGYAADRGGNEMVTTRRAI